jgi:spore coat protein A
MTPRFFRREIPSFHAILAILLAAGSSARADSVNLTAARDVTLYSEADDKANGSGDYFFAGQTNGGNRRRGLVRFDVSGIPAGSTINSTTLTLYMSRTIAGNQNVNLHRVLADWGEGASNAGGQEGDPTSAALNDATWRYRFYDPNNPGSAPQWAVLGGDFVGTASATTIVGNSTGSYSWSSASMSGDVSAWVNNSSSNYGWILIGNETTQPTAKRFNSRTSSNASRRPLLSVNFTPPATTGACCFSDGSCQILSQTNCTTQSGVYQGNGTTCTPNPCPQPTGACCFANGSCQILTQVNCAAQSGSYQGNDTVCMPNPCQQPTGACCFTDGSCQELTAAACTTANGSYQGDGTTCMPNPCPQPTGACCLNNGTCQVLTEADCTALSGTYQGDDTTCTPNLCPIILTPYVDPLPIPPLATPTTGMPGGEATYDIEIVQVQQQLHSELPPTTLWTYEGIFPGPTILATRGLPVTVNWINDLRDGMGVPRTTHYLSVDLCPHGAANLPKVVTHLHGGHVPAAVDGYPESTFLPGNAVSYVYPNNQLPALIWYHDHALGITRLNVYMGMAGGYLITDAFEQSLNLPSGEYDVPLIIQDRRFNPDGSLYYPAVWEEHFFGDKMLVNGKVWPFLNVKQGKYRFRALNGCNSRVLTLSLSNGQSFQQIGADGGLLPAPVTVTQVTIGGGERADLIIDFAAHLPGTEILLTNSAQAPFPQGNPIYDIPNIMKFVVVAQPGDIDPVPPALRPLETLDPMDAVQTRELTLQKTTDPCSGSVWLINGMHWDHISEYPVLGTTEVWSFINRSGISHPMHMHLVFFQVLDRQDFDIVMGEVVPVGEPIPPAPNEAGWKDTVMAHPNQITRVITRFADYTGKYPYHCHILEHEDHEMMRQFEAVCIKGDTNQDTLVDGRDIALFVEAMIGTVSTGTAQFCATDMDSNLALETAFDIDLFVNCLVAGACP